MIDPILYIVFGAIVLFSLIFTCIVFYRSEQYIPTYSLLRLGYELRKASQALPASLLALAIVNTLFLLFAQADPSHHIFLAIICTDGIFFPALVLGYRRISLLKKRLRVLRLEWQEQTSKEQQEAPAAPPALATDVAKKVEATIPCLSCGTPLLPGAVCPTCSPSSGGSMYIESESSDEQSNPYEEHLAFVENLSARSTGQPVPVPQGASQETDDKQRQLEELIQRYGQWRPEHSRPPRRSGSALLLSALICIFYASSNWWSTMQSVGPLSANKLTLLAGWSILILFALGFIAFTLIAMRSRDQ